MNITQINYRHLQSKQIMFLIIQTRGQGFAIALGFLLEDRFKIVVHNLLNYYVCTLAIPIEACKTNLSVPNLMSVLLNPMTSSTL